VRSAGNPLNPKMSRGRASGTARASRGPARAWSGADVQAAGFEGDLVAECFELVDVVAFLVSRADAVVVEVGAQVVVAGPQIRQRGQWSG
jgi:hypothetical protein